MQHDGGQVPTFVDYGFSGFPEILPIVKGKKVPPAEVVLPRNKEACKKYLAFQMEALDLTSPKQGWQHAGLVLALAYFLDGSVECHGREFGVENAASLTITYAPEFYKTPECPKGCGSNLEAMSRIYVPKGPEALLILQEIPGEPKNYHFRLIHTARVKPGTGKLAKKLRLLDACTSYFQTFQGKEVYTRQDINEIRAIMEFVSILDPQEKYVDREEFRIRDPEEERPDFSTKILSFEADKKQ